MGIDETDCTVISFAMRSLLWKKYYSWNSCCKL